MTSTARTADWIEAQPTGLEILAVMFVGVAGIMIAGLQPLLLETLSQRQADAQPAGPGGGRRVNWLWTIIVSATLAAIVLYGFYSLPSPEMLLVLSGAFGFLWLFVLPFLAPMVIEADPTRRAAVLIGGAQVLGASFGPFVASLFVTAEDSRGAVVFGGACMIAAILLAFGLHQIRPRKAVSEGAQ